MTRQGRIIFGSGGVAGERQSHLALGSQRKQAAEHGKTGSRHSALGTRLNAKATGKKLPASTFTRRRYGLRRFGVLLPSKLRRAEFTASSLGNARAISGSSNTILLLSRTRCACFPRTPPESAPKSYSGRRSSLGLRRAFLVEVPFGRRCRARADDSYFFVIFGVGYYKNTSNPRHPDSKKTVLPGRVVRIGKCC